MTSFSSLALQPDVSLGLLNDPRYLFLSRSTTLPYLHPNTLASTSTPSTHVSRSRLIATYCYRNKPKPCSTPCPRSAMFYPTNSPICATCHAHFFRLKSLGLIAFDEEYIKVQLPPAFY
ncbi:hypothetical protein L798_03445 [Zootermopsis nevadensis]|uniref:Uncharacterized protein n=1 Tax=Zootermopsis nevadensis TaxID=136037 RepID=A0A067QGN6_ZOONE|nr:hypothetical protein L798_03445 [Zootermopsis nevadensis]